MERSINDYLFDQQLSSLHGRPHELRVRDLEVTFRSPEKANANLQRSFRCCQLDQLLDLTAARPHTSFRLQHMNSKGSGNDERHHVKFMFSFSPGHTFTSVSTC
ncbi:Hypothetical protein SMAX5B_021347 [Scophthalmus maximus]|uniref:Uncharacterized protein n=1 Tax=Scophthalmus maximus TaxID=52904 RepID=A0A2U9BMS9_SCOMX|nr:Hypothetical protein SMAX5B_021347 [Scophthalmus maximus]